MTAALAIAGPHVIHEVFDDEVVIVNLETGRYYTMSESGAAIWTMIRDGVAIADIRSAIGRRYEGAAAELDAAVDRFLAELEREGLATPAAASSLPSPAAAPVEPRPAFQPPTLQKYTDMQDLLLLDPIHEVDETGWPNKRPEEA
jgi:hypothetical protein